MKFKNRIRRIFNKKAGASVGVAIKVLTSVVLGAAMLAGTYGIVKTNVVPTAENKVSSMFEATDTITLGGGGSGGVVVPDPVVEIKRNGVIPEGGTYTVAATSTVLSTGDNFPDTPATGDTYDEGDYCYGYNLTYDSYYDDWYTYEVQNGWGVRIKDRTQITYGEILSEIAEEPVVSMDSTFCGCTFLTTPPKIPNSIKDMPNTFSGCTSLTTAPTMPSSVTNMGGTFYDCTSLTTAPVIPNSVTNMALTFDCCTSLTNAPAIPSSVTDMYGTFSDCTSLTGTIEVNANPTSYDDCLGNTQITGITGSCSQETKDALMATK